MQVVYALRLECIEAVEMHKLNELKTLISNQHEKLFSSSSARAEATQRGSQAENRLRALWSVFSLGYRLNISDFPFVLQEQKNRLKLFKGQSLEKSIIQADQRCQPVCLSWWGTDGTRAAPYAQLEVDNCWLVTCREQGSAHWISEQNMKEQELGFCNASSWLAENLLISPWVINLKGLNELLSTSSRKSKWGPSRKGFKLISLKVVEGSTSSWPACSPLHNHQLTGFGRRS